MDKLHNDIQSFIAANSDAIRRDIARLVAVDSVEGTPTDSAPFGEKPKAALTLALDIAQELGLGTRNCENYMGYAFVGGDGEDHIATITHVDVVPAGDGWTGDAFTLRERDGYIIGRGVQDDKGPSVICLYALKYLLESGVELRYPVRALLGTSEETGMKDVEYYLSHYTAPLFCFSPDADFPLCNGEKGHVNGLVRAAQPAENVTDIRGGMAFNMIPDRAEATVKAEDLSSTEFVTATEIEPGLWKLSAKGKSGHASTPQGSKNAIGVLVDYLLANGIPSEGETPYYEALAALHRDYTGALLGVASHDDIFTPLTIIGGTIGVENGFAVQSFDCRYPTGTDGDTIASQIQRTAGAAAVISVVEDSEPFYASVDDPAVTACLDAYRAVTGDSSAKPFTIGGGTYARYFPHAVSFGPDHPEKSRPAFAGAMHSADEAACFDELTEALEIYIRAILSLEQLTPDELAGK